jgi:hypothetical protein
MNAFSPVEAAPNIARLRARIMLVDQLARDGTHRFIVI